MGDGRSRTVGTPGQESSTKENPQRPENPQIHPARMDAMVTPPPLYAHIAGMILVVIGIALHLFWPIVIGLALMFISDTVLIAVDYYEHRNPGSTH